MYFSCSYHHHVNKNRIIVYLLKTIVRAGNVYGFDIVNFWDLGFKMFRDRDRFNARFVQADIMNAEGTLAEFKGKLDMIYVAQVRRTAWAPKPTSHPQFSRANKHIFRIGHSPLGLGRSGRSLQEARQPRQARLLDRRRPGRKFDGPVESVGFHTSAAIPTQRTIVCEDVGGSWHCHWYDLGVLVVVADVHGDVLARRRHGVDGRKCAYDGVCRAAGELSLRFRDVF